MLCDSKVLPVTKNELFRDLHTNSKKRVTANLFSTLFDTQLIYLSSEYYEYISQKLAW